MSVKSFKFVSPGIFINEIDNSFIPRGPEAIGPVIIGRSTRGLAMTPVKVESYADFVTQFGDTVAGSGGGDIHRDGNFQSPMYGTYAAKAFLDSQTAPITYIRLLGQQTDDGKADGGAAAAGWDVQKSPTTTAATNGGAYALFVAASGAMKATDHPAAANSTIGSAYHAATFYLNKGQMFLSGNLCIGSAVDTTQEGMGTHTVIDTGTDGIFNIVISGTSLQETISFDLDDTSDNFLRKKFNTNPQLAGENATSFFPESTKKDYWLGESFEQAIRKQGLHSPGKKRGVLIPLGFDGGTIANPSKMKGQAATEAKAGWFIGQDTGLTAVYEPENMQKLFRLIGRGHGEWLHKNCKVSIEKIRQSTNKSYPYGSFSVVIRDLYDTDANVTVVERFDRCNLDPASPNYVARKIGNQYVEWDKTEKRLKTYGEYPNNSKFVYVDMNQDVEDGSTGFPELLPFGYFGPPKPSNIIGITGSGLPYASAAKGLGTFVVSKNTVVAPVGQNEDPAGKYHAQSALVFFSGALGAEGASVTVTPRGALSGSLIFASASLRVSASDGGLRNPKHAYFGFSANRSADKNVGCRSVADYHRMPYQGYADSDPTTTVHGTNGVDGWSYVFSLDDVTPYYGYQSGSRKLGDSKTSSSYTDILNAGYNRFTAPFWGGFDGFDVFKPDPLYNGAIAAGTETEDNSYVYNTWRRAIDTVSDPEAIDMNLLVAPGLTHEGLTERMVDVCEERADALALIDLPDVYIPPHEQYYADKSSRIGTTPRGAARQLRDRKIDSSYGATFYPWVQTRDQGTGQLVWIPPSVAILGVLASAAAKTDVWFAPAGFNRGGLSDGAAGIPITKVSEKLTSKNRDILYEYNVNPIASFPSSGIVLFGQKTLQERQSALDRINVRRLVIYLKKQVSILSTQVLFEQNVQATWNRFIGLVEPLLSNVKTRFGITDYRLILDETTTTPDLIDQNIMYAKIMIKPARAIEFIAIDFVILNTGASFDD